MTKNKFLKELEIKLSILDEQEITETINEYKDIIDQKVESGKTEKEAVLEFGSIDELAEEILKAYKINTKKINNEHEEPLNFEEGIKSAAQKCADVTKNIFESGTTLSIETIFEIIIKFILLLVGLAVLRLPFHLIDSLGSGILSFNIYPIDEIMEFIWGLLTSIAYLITCGLVFILVFKEYFKTSDTKDDDKDEEPKKKEIVKKTEKKIKENKNVGNGLSKTLIMICKLILIVAVFVPLVFTQIGIGIATVIFIYYAATGVAFYGIIILLIGLLIGFGWILDLIIQVLKGFNSFRIYNLIIAIVAIMFGGFLTGVELLKIEYVNKAPKTDFKTTIIEESFKIDRPLDIYANDSEVRFVEDKKMKDGEVLVQITYNKDFYELRNFEIKTGLDNEDYLEITKYNRNDIEQFKATYNLIIENLKKDKIYNYENLFEMQIEVIANRETLRLIED